MMQRSGENSNSNTTFEYHWRLFAAMRRVKEQAEQFSQPFCTKAGITPLQLRVLMALYFAGPQTVSALARQMCMAGANSSALCKKLEQGGYVLRRREKQDERRVYISLAPPGEELMVAYMETASGQYKKWQQTIPREEAAAVLAGLSRMAEVLEQNEESTL